MNVQFPPEVFSLIKSYTPHDIHVLRASDIYNENPDFFYRESLHQGRTIRHGFMNLKYSRKRKNVRQTYSLNRLTSTPRFVACLVPKELIPIYELKVIIYANFSSKITIFDDSTHSKYRRLIFDAPAIFVSSIKFSKQFVRSDLDNLYFVFNEQLLLKNK